MPAQRKYDSETRARAVRMYQDRLRDHGDESKLEARRQVRAFDAFTPDNDPYGEHDWIFWNATGQETRAQGRYARTPTSTA
jgi:hypothetical protein